MTFKEISTQEVRQKWSQLGCIWETSTFKYYANYLNLVDDIVPESIGRTCIEQILNPYNYRWFYSDKNMFLVICGYKNVVKTILCRINGGQLLDGMFRRVTVPIKDILKNHDKILLKPSVDSKGGDGIILFNRVGEDFYCGDIILSKEMLLRYSNDFSLQEVVCQHEKLASLNESSVNTLRIAVYRSVVDENVHIIASIIRIGSSGMFVDNASSGGKYAKVDIDSGRVDTSLRDAYGGVYSMHNNIDFSSLEFYIPGWQQIKDKCIEIAHKIPHHRLIAFDMTITEDMRPILVEFNVDSYSYWLFMYTNQPPLGKFTNEIIEYCKMRLKD